MNPPTVSQELTDCEKDHLDINKIYTAIKELSDKDITLFFQRLCEIQKKRISPGCTDENLREIRDSIRGINFVEAKLKQIKKEQLSA